MGTEPHAPARRVDPAARAVTALGSRGLLASLRSVGGTRSLFAKVSKFVAAFGARGVRNRVGNRKCTAEIQLHGSSTVPPSCLPQARLSCAAVRHHALPPRTQMPSSPTASRRRHPSHRTPFVTGSSSTSAIRASAAHTAFANAARAAEAHARPRRRPNHTRRRRQPVGGARRHSAVRPPEYQHSRRGRVGGGDGAAVFSPFGSHRSAAPAPLLAASSGR